MTAPRVLVVEDDGLQALALEDMLEEMGCQVAASFGNVAKALAWLEAGGQVDAALLDVNIDGEHTYAVADLLLARRAPFCFTSGYGQVSERRFATTPMLGKPLNRQNLLATLRGFGLAL